MKSVAFILLIFVSVFGRENTLIPNGSQLEYWFQGEAKSGSRNAKEAFSQWSLGATLLLTNTDGVVTAQLRDFNTSLFNGPNDDAPDVLPAMPVPEAVALTLGLPFLINYNGSAVKSIGISDNDILWSINIKRAIASVLQLDLNTITKPVSFSSETNLFGYCEDVQYNIEDSADYKTIRKVIDHRNCKNYREFIWNSASKTPCSKQKEKSHLSNTFREYKIRENTLESIKSERIHFIQPFNSQGVIQQTKQTQQFILKSSAQLKNPPKMSENFRETSIVYEFNINNLSSGRIDLLEREKYMLQSKNQLLDTIVSNLNSTNLTENIVDYHRDLLFLYYDLFMLTEDSLKTLYENLSMGTSYEQETKRNIFLEFLPQVGSESSVNFLKYLILNRKVKAENIIKMLSIFPLYVKEYSEKLLDDMQVLLNMNEKFNKDIRNSAVLSYATLVYKTYSAGKCDLDRIENTAIKYFHLFSESSNYEKQMIYLQALDNLQFNGVPKYLISVVNNKKLPENIRISANWALAKYTQNKFENVYELQWELLTNTSEHLELRTSALVATLLAEPKKSQFLQIFRFMQTEKNPHLYHFYYTTIISLQRATHPCLEKLSELSREIINFMKPSTSSLWTTGNYVVDYKDSERDFGGLLNLILIGSSQSFAPNVIYFNLNNYENDKNINKISVYIKTQGVSVKLEEFLKRNVYINRIKNLKQILETVQIESTNETLHFEIIVKVQDKTVFCLHVGSEGLKQLKDGAKIFAGLTEYHINHQSILMPNIEEYIEPSDLGTLVIKAVLSNTIASTRGNYLFQVSDDVNKYQTDADIRIFTSTINFLELYNPISDTWHGMERNKKTQIQIAFNTTLNVNKDKFAIELLQNHVNDDFLNVLFHSDEYTYLVSNGTSPLKTFCPKCSYIFNITAAPFTKTETLLDKTDDSGNQIKISAFDFDDKTIYYKSLEAINTAHQSNSQVVPASRILLYFMHSLDYISYIPCAGRCGLSLNVKQKIQQGDQIQYLLTSNENELSLVANQKNVTYSEMLKVWSLLLKFDWFENKQIINTILDYKSKERTDKEKICVTSSFNLPNLLQNEQKINVNLFGIKECYEENESCRRNCIHLETFLIDLLKSTHFLTRENNNE